MRNFRALFIGIAVCVALTASAAAYEPLFDTWMGFPTGDYTNARFCYAAEAGDLNGDGAVDVVVAQWPWATGFALLINRGDGTFFDAVRYPSAYPSLGLTLADVDGDNDDDVVLSNTGYNYEGSTISVYLNDGNGAFGPQQQFTVGSGAHVAPFGVCVDDFDGDLLPDVVVAKYGWIGQGTTVALLPGDGNGGFGAPVDFAAGPGPCHLACADVNGDELLDVAVANEEYPHLASVLLNDGDGGFLPPASYSYAVGVVGGYPTVALADVDNDDDVDLLLSNSGVRAGVNDERGAVLLFRNQGDGSMAPGETIPLIEYTAGPVDLAVDDVNEDGWLDVIGAHASGRNRDGWELALNDGAGGFLPATLYHAGQTTIAVMTGDADGDDDLDVLTADNYSMEVTVEENRGGGTFEQPPTYQTVAISINLDAADIDLDNDLDLLSTGGITYPVPAGVLLNNGDGTFAPYEYIAPPWETTRGKLRDLDGDTFPDLLLAGGPPYSFFTGKGNGDGTFQPTVEWPVPSCGSGDIDAFDLDGDQDLDICYLEYLGCPGGGGTQVFISRNRGNGTFDPPYSVTVHQGPYAMVGGDFNGDQNIDLAIACYGYYGSENRVSVLLGMGNGFFQPYQAYVVPYGPKAIVAADLNGDKILDLATENTGANTGDIETMSVLMGRGNGTFDPYQFYYAAYSHDLLAASGITCGDPDGDGDIDLMTSNAGSNDISYFENRGDGTFETQVRYGLGAGPHSVIYADFTGDGVGDLASLVNHPPYDLDVGAVIVRGIGTGASDVSTFDAVATRLILRPAAPNPFTTGTRFSYDLPVPGTVRLRVFDPAGRTVATLRDGFAAAGRHEAFWNGRDAHGRRAGAGVYFLRLEQGNDATSGKIMVVE